MRSSAGSSKKHSSLDVAPVDLVSILRRKIPSGTPVNDAIKFMTDHGFQCQIERNSSFLADLCDGSHATKPETIDGIDFILCTRSNHEQPLVRIVTSVALILSENLVSDIRIKVTGFGP